MKWRFLDTGHNNAFYNMAVDEALMQLSNIPTIRFYGWKPAAVSFGYFQNIKEVNADYCKKNNVDIIRRISGGRAVLHDKELTYSITINKELTPDSIIGSYKQISNGILTALDMLGVHAVMNDKRISKKSIFQNKPIFSPICFVEPSYYEITASNKKIAGSAQKRKNNKILQHGSILIDVDFEKLFSVFNINTDIEKEGIRNRITSINNEIDDRLSYSDIAKALKKGFEENFKINLQRGRLSDEEIELTNSLIKDKYNQNKNAK